MGLRLRMLLGMAMPMGAFGAAIVLALWQVQALGTQLELTVTRDGKRAELAHRLNAALLDVGMQQRTLITLTDPEDLKAQKVVLDQARQRYLAAEQQLGDFSAGTDDPMQSDIAATLAEIRGLRQSISTVYDDAVRIAMEGRGAEAALVLLLPAEATEQQWRQGIAAIVERITEANQLAFESAQQQQRRARVVVLATSALAVLLSVLLAVRLASGVTVRVVEATFSAERMATGDLAHPIATQDNTSEQGQDEVGRLLAAVGAMQEKLREIVTGLRRSAEVVTSSSKEIADGSHDLSSGAELAAARLQETAGTVRELTERVTQTAQAAQHASELANAARSQASAGGQSVAQADLEMRGVAAAMARMGDIVELIQGIAQQTHMLSLNAAVEAARAGDAGRGFAVVAFEVRRLAQRAADAVQQIKALSAEAGTQVANSSQQVAQAGVAARALEAVANQVADTMHAITADTQQQAQGLLAIDDAIHQLDTVTQHNAAMSEQSAAAAHHLSEQAAQLALLVQMFKLGGEKEVAGAELSLPLNA